MDQFGANRKPNWSKWRLIPEVKVFQAVALSLDIDPDKVRRSPTAWMSESVGFHEGQDFEDRLDVVGANVKSDGPLVPVSYGIGHRALVPIKLREFAAWCLSIGWPIPDELRALAGTDSARPLEVPLPPDGPTREASSQRTYDPSKAGTGRSATATAADEYFRQHNAQLAAQVAKFANEAGYVELIATVEAKDLHLNLAPDWPHWANMTCVTVSDAACLSLGISPEARLPQINLSVVRERARDSNASSTRVVLGLAALERAQRIIQQRVEQAMSAQEAGRLSVCGPRNVHQMLGLESSPGLVSLPRYRRWAESLPQPYTFPEGFPPAEPRSEPAVYSSAQPEAPASDGEKPLREPERGNLLAIIHALADMAKLPERGAASSVERQLQELKYDTPKERTIRAVLNEARKIED